MSLDLAIHTQGLSKDYVLEGKKTHHAVNNINIQVKKGEIYGFIGPNGAGKTTTLKMLLGLTNPTKGKIEILGHPIDHTYIRQKISYLPEKFYSYDYLTGMETLQFYGSLFQLKDKNYFEGLLEKVGLKKVKDVVTKKYSKGMLQRLGIAQCLLNNPQLLFLDEPMSGLDPIAHIEIRDLLLSFKEEKKTIFLCSHELNEVEKICDRISILNHGQVVKEGSLNELLGTKKIELKYEKENLFYLNEFEDLQTTQNQIDLLRKENIVIHSLSPKRKTLEDLFIENTK